VRKLIIAAALMFAAPSPAEAWASPMTGEDWLKACTTKSVSDECFAYTAGVADTTQVFQFWFPDTDKSCIPNGMSLTELIIAGKNFISAHPYYHQLPAAWGLAAAFNRTWPCTK
jgi:hypothetical protein